MAEGVNLVAMSRSGATLLVRDRTGRLWLYPPEAAGTPRVVDPEAAAQIIARADLEEIQQELPGWQELEAYRQQKAAELAPDPMVDLDDLDAEDAERLLETADRWITAGESERARRLAIRLLRAPVALNDPSVRERLVSMLERLEAPRLQLVTEPRTPIQRRARERWQMPRAA